MKTKLLGLVGALGIVGGLAVAASPGQSADHLDAPNVQVDGRTDINDVYAFQSPTNADNTVLVMTVNPGAGALPNSSTTFHPKAAYLFKVDNTGDGIADTQVKVRFGRPDAMGEQRVRVVTPAGVSRGTTGDNIRLPGGGEATAGLYDDPFFFDFVAFQDQVKGAGGGRTFCDGGETDFFAGLDVSAIVVEVPSDQLTANGSDVINVWGVTATAARGRIDRMGNPAIATVLIDDGAEIRFNKTRPAGDERKFSTMVRRNLRILSGLDGSGYTRAEATDVAGLLLPDMLTLDTSSSAGFVDGPLNGRQLAEDVIDFELFVVTGGLAASGSPVLTSDCVDANDVAFPMQFPYLAPAHN